MRFRTGYDTDYKSSVYDTIVDDDGGAVQYQKDDCDLNLIFERASRGQDIPVTSKIPLFDESGEYLDYVDYRENMDKMIQAEESFVQNVPAKVRRYYNNDPAEFYRAVAVKDEYLISQGIIKEGKTGDASPAAHDPLDVMGTTDTNTKKEDE